METEPKYIELGPAERPAARLYFMGDRAVRVQLARGGVFGEARFARDVLLPHRAVADGPDVRVARGPEGATGADYQGLSVRFLADPDRLAFLFDGWAFLTQFITPDASPRLEFGADPDEGFYGFGEWFNGFRRASGRLELHNREAPAFTQHKRTYSAFPCFLSDRGYLAAVLNGHRALARINDPAGRLRLDFSGGSLDYLLVYGPSFKDILETYTRLTGRPPLPPLWALGLWNTAYPVENQAQTEQRVRDHREKDYPLDAVILDYHWEAGFHDFRFRKSLFPDPAGMIRRLGDQGVKLGLIYTPYINKNAFCLYKHLVRLYVKNAPEGVPFFANDHADETYREGLARGFFAHPDVTWWLGRGGAVDFTNPAAVDWWFGKQKPLLALGVRFFKNDGGEYLPDQGSKSALGLDPGEFHNLYGFYYAKALYEKLADHFDGRRALIFSRTTWIGSQRYPAAFLGDQTPEFKHIEAVMRCGLNMGLQGFAWWGADVLGLYRRPEAELHERHAQWTLFSPIARYFSAPGAAERNPWGHGPRAAESFKTHLHLRLRLLPHYYRLAAEAFDRGLPLIRPLVMEFQDDPRVRDIWRQALIGECLMAAPVLEPGAREQTVYFPAGRWFSFWDDREYAGPGWASVPVEPDRLPLFVRGGYPLVLGPVMPYIQEGHRFDDLEIMIYPPFTGRAVLYEDDGETTDYARGARSFQEFVFGPDPAGGGLVVSIGAVSGDFPGRPSARRIVFTFCRGPRMTGVEWDPGPDDSKESLTWRYDEVNQRLSAAGTFPTDRAGRILLKFEQGTEPT